jgi:DNA-binding MarR family transcriptional regulator
MIARLTNLDKMTVSNSIRLLASSGYLIREEHTVDTRAKSVNLTKKGKELVKKLVPIVEGIDAKFFGVLSKTDQKKLVQLFNTIHSRGKHE